jgi:hypothetical protein
MLLLIISVYLSFFYFLQLVFILFMLWCVTACYYFVIINVVSHFNVIYYFNYQVILPLPVFIFFLEVMYVRIWLLLYVYYCYVVLHIMTLLSIIIVYCNLRYVIVYTVPYLLYMRLIIKMYVVLFCLLIYFICVHTFLYYSKFIF